MTRSELSEGTLFYKQERVKIQNILDNQIQAWNNKDAEAYAKDFDEDGSFTNIIGSFALGKIIFQEKHEKIFKSIFNKSTFHQQLVHLQFVRPDVAIAESLITVREFLKQGPFAKLHTDEEGLLRTYLLQVMVKENGAWKIQAYHNVDVKATGQEKPV